MGASLVTVAKGLRFPEGPVWQPDGSVVLVEIERASVTRVHPNGKLETVAQLEGGPNGLAVGPDGAFYVCNNGGFNWEEKDGVLIPSGQPTTYTGGRIERVDPCSGKVCVLYDNCNHRPLSGPNDLVFDEFGGFYFTDIGKVREYDRDHGGVYYATADGSKIMAVIYPMTSPNGCGLTSDGKILYVADMEPARLWAFNITSPGVVEKTSFPASANGGRLVAGLSKFQGFDSLALDSSGRICIGTVWGKPQITVISPAGEIEHEIEMPDPFPTNICFGGADHRTAFVTLSGKGELVSFLWDRPGADLAFKGS